MRLEIEIGFAVGELVVVLLLFFYYSALDVRLFRAYQILAHTFRLDK